MPYIGKKPADIIATVIDTTTGTFSGEVDAGSLDVSGNADIDGITNLDNTDIDGTLDVSGNLTVDTNTLYVDSANNRVGVGTGSPNEKLTISSGAISFLGEISTPSIGAGLFRPANNTLAVVTGGSESMRIDSSGNLLVGGTSVGVGTGNFIYSNGFQVQSKFQNQLMQPASLFLHH